MFAKPVAFAVAPSVQVRAELSAPLLTLAVAGAQVPVAALRAGTAIPRDVVTRETRLTLAGVLTGGAPRPRRAGVLAGVTVIARGAVTVPRDRMAPGPVLTPAHLHTPGAPLTGGAAEPLTVSSTVARLTPAHSGRVTLPVSAALRTVRLTLATLRLEVARAAELASHRPADVLLSPPGLHGAHPVRAEEGRRQAERMLLDLDRLQVRDIHKLRLQNLK